MKITKTRLKQIIKEEVSLLVELRAPDPAQSSRIMQNIIGLIQSGQLGPRDIATILPLLSINNAKTIIASLSLEAKIATGAAMVQAGVAMAIVLALFGSLALLFYYPIARSRESKNQLKTFARNLQRPALPSDFTGDEAKRHLEFIALSIEDFEGEGGNTIRDLMSDNAVRLVGGTRDGEKIPAIDEEFVSAARKYSNGLRLEAEASSGDDFGTLVELFPEIEVEQEIDDEPGLDECIPLAKIIMPGQLSTGTRGFGTLSFPILENVRNLLEYLNIIIFFITRHFSNTHMYKASADDASMSETHLPNLEAIRDSIEKIIEKGCFTLREWVALMDNLSRVLSQLENIFDNLKEAGRLSSTELETIYRTTGRLLMNNVELNNNLLEWLSAYYPRTTREYIALKL